jgi:hypothetical protein
MYRVYGITGTKPGSTAGTSAGGGYGFVNPILVVTGKTVGYATGGYTGEWGPEGKLAVLHEKEIVLNKHDTENLLMAVDMLSNILSTIDSYATN